MQPYFQNHLVTLYHGDCREVLPSLHLQAPTVITDPVWPNALPQLQGGDRPCELFAEMLQVVDPKRLAVHLGCDSDPLLLAPVTLPFFRVAWLRYSCPGRKGRLLQGADVAYLYGPPPAAAPGKHLIPGEVTSSRAGRETAHPCPRKLKHVSWLINYWSEPSDTIVDPFCGSGTTLLAAFEHGRTAVGVEIDESFCEMTASRFDQGHLPLLVSAGLNSA
jgi:hypothetical protein